MQEGMCEGRKINFAYEMTGEMALGVLKKAVGGERAVDERSFA